MHLQQVSWSFVLSVLVLLNYASKITTQTTHGIVVSDGFGACLHVDHGEALAFVVVEDEHIAVGEVRSAARQVELSLRARQDAGPLVRYAAAC